LLEYLDSQVSVALELFLKGRNVMQSNKESAPMIDKRTRRTGVGYYMVHSAFFV